MKCFYVLHAKRTDFYYWGTVTIQKDKVYSYRFGNYKNQIKKHFSGSVFVNELGFHKVTYREDWWFGKRVYRIAKSKVPQDFINYIESNAWVLDVPHKNEWHEL